jgi:hypothetical protein
MTLMERVAKQTSAARQVAEGVPRYEGRRYTGQYPSALGRYTIFDTVARETVTETIYWRETLDEARDLADELNALAIVDPACDVARRNHDARREYGSLLRQQTLLDSLKGETIKQSDPAVLAAQRQLEDAIQDRLVRNAGVRTTTNMNLILDATIHQPERWIEASGKAYTSGAAKVVIAYRYRWEVTVVAVVYHHKDTAHAGLYWNDHTPLASIPPHQVPLVAHRVAETLYGRAIGKRAYNDNHGQEKPDA